MGGTAAEHGIQSLLFTYMPKDFDYIMTILRSSKASSHHTTWAGIKRTFASTFITYFWFSKECKALKKHLHVLGNILLNSAFDAYEKESTEFIGRRTLLLMPTKLKFAHHTGKYLGSGTSSPEIPESALQLWTKYSRILWDVQRAQSTNSLPLGPKDLERIFSSRDRLWDAVAGQRSPCT